MLALLAPQGAVAVVLALLAPQEAVAIALAVIAPQGVRLGRRFSTKRENSSPSGVLEGILPSKVSHGDENSRGAQSERCDG